MYRSSVKYYSTCVILGAIEDHKDIGVSSRVLFVTSLYPNCVCCRHGCNENKPHYYYFFNMQLFISSKVSLNPQHCVSLLSQRSYNIALTFLFQAESGFRVFLIIISFPHKSLVHRNQLPGKLPIILINSQPAFTGEKVPKNNKGLERDTANTVCLFSLFSSCRKI